MGGFLRRFGASFLLLNAGVFVLPATAHAQRVCPIVGQVIGSSVVASGCVERRGVPGQPGGSDLTCTYDLLIANDVTSSVGLYRTGDVFSTGPADGGGQIVQVTVHVTPGGGSNLEFETMPSSGAAREFSSTGRWYRKFCDNEDGQLVSVEGPLPSGPSRPLGDVVDEALAQLQAPPPQPFDHSGPASVLQLPTFFWLSTVNFDDPPQTASASHGLLTVTATIEPDRYFMEVDGDTIICEDRNTPWTPGLAEDDPVACSHVFEDPAEHGGVVLVDLVIEYTTSWSANVPAFATPQALDPIPVRTENIEHELVEILGLSG